MKPKPQKKLTQKKTLDKMWTIVRKRGWLWSWLWNILDVLRKSKKKINSAPNRGRMGERGRERDRGNLGGIKIAAESLSFSLFALLDRKSHLEDKRSPWGIRTCRPVSVSSLWKQVAPSQNLFTLPFFLVGFFYAQWLFVCPPSHEWILAFNTERAREREAPPLANKKYVWIRVTFRVWITETIHDSRAPFLSGDVLRCLCCVLVRVSLVLLCLAQRCALVGNTVSFFFCCKVACRTRRPRIKVSVWRVNPRLAAQLFFSFFRVTPVIRLVLKKKWLKIYEAC